MVFDRSSGEPCATYPKSIPAPEQGRASARCEEDRHFLRVLLGFRGYDDHREREPRVSGAHLWERALSKNGGVSSRETRTANRRLNSRLLRRRLVRTLK